MSEDDDADVVLKRGEWGHVVLARCADGTVPALDFLDTLSMQAQNQFTVRIEYLAEFGRITNDRQFHYLQHDDQPRVAEIKLTPGPGYRFYCILEGRVWVVTHGTIKPKSAKRYQPEIDRAQQIYSERRGTP